MTNGKRRRASLILLGLCLLLIAVIGWQMWRGIQGARRVGASYNTGIIVQPVTAELCPGEALIYTQSIHVASTAMVDISREWCNRGGTCDLDLHQSWVNVVSTPLDFTGQVTRTVPVTTWFKAGGLYEFRSGVRNGELSVQIVPFSIREDCAGK